MAMNQEKQRTEFCYHKIKLYKSESLGSGSYGGVCKAVCDGLLCAAKIMHPTLFDPRDPGTVSYLRKFQKECHLLSLARHPNIVQYLATYNDPDTQLPVLLMELCDENLTVFLERSQAPLSYHIELNICHDIALALVYLHSNGLIHRDLTGNNVLMIAGTRAKVTDFGMSKLASVNPHMTALTLCPGNVLYMSPEALDEAKSYTAKLDIFSFGVIIIQTLTRLFPNPTNRYRAVYIPDFDEPLQQLIPDTERRQAHLQLISDTHSLKPLAIQCLKKNEMDRPSALQLSERLSDLKQTPQYTESVYRAQTSSDIQQLRQQLQGLRILAEAKTKEASEHQVQTMELQTVVEEKEHIIEMKDRKIHENECMIENKERELQEQMSASMRLVSNFQQRLQQKDKVISDLQQTVSAQEIKIQQLQQQEKENRAQTQLQSITTHTSATTVAAAPADISKITWREGKNAPEIIYREAAVVHGNTAYFRPFRSQKVYSYQNIEGEEQWTTLPDNPNEGSGLAVIDGFLTSVGGYKHGYVDTLLSFTGKIERKGWSVIFPPMPTPRQGAACITTKQALVVAGGFMGTNLDTVEVMDINTKQWSTVCPLARKLAHYSSVVFGDTLYLAGGFCGRVSKSVFTCSLTDLWQPVTRAGSGKRGKCNVWKQISSLPESYSTLALFGSHLLAIGGRDDLGFTTNNVYMYDSHTDSWNVISKMNNKRSWCFAVTLSHDQLLVVGGIKMDSVEIGQI